MFVNGLGTANPPRSYSKAECWEAFKASDWFLKLDRRAHIIAETVLTKDNGIASRSLAVDSLNEVFAIDPDTLHAPVPGQCPARWPRPPARRRCRKPRSPQAKSTAWSSAPAPATFAPGLTSYVIERLGLRPDVLAFDLVGQGCAAALPNWRLADALLAAGSCRHVLSICVEVSSAAMYLDNDPGRADQRLPVWRRRRRSGAVRQRQPATPQHRMEVVRVAGQSGRARRAAVRNPERHAAQHPDPTGSPAGGRARRAGAAHGARRSRPRSPRT